jgi:hypothetical protein
LHDTPTKALFTTAARYLSSGCVRVEEVSVLINWILNGQDGWSPARIQQIKESEERLDVKVQNPPQVRTVYLTSWVNGSGEVNFRPDVYNLDDTDFIVGQPLAPGELSDNGLRYVLKAQVYKVEEVPDEPAFFSLFGSRRKTKNNDDSFSFFGSRETERGRSSPFFFGSSTDKSKKSASDDDDGIGTIFNFNRPAMGKLKKKSSDKIKKKQATAGKKKPLVPSNTKKKTEETAAVEKKSRPAGTGEPVKKKKKVEEASATAATPAPAASTGPQFGQQAP